LQQSKDKLNEKIISYYFEIFEHTSELFLKDTKHNFIDNITDDKALRQKFEELLTLLRISIVQNLFVVTKDSDKNYYFLLDSETDPQKRSELYEPFSPQSDNWDISYKTQTPQIYKHRNNKNLWVSIVYPIVQNNKTVALFGADISYTLDNNIQMTLQSFRTFFIGITGISITWFIFLYFTTLYFRRKYHDGYRDPLTMIYNRRYLHDVLVKNLGRSYQLYMLDIDFFKKVNDTYGHDIGDIVLKEVTKRIENIMRNDDIFIRFGGEEFLIYTSDLNEKQSQLFAERMRVSILERPIIHGSITCTVTISIGVNPHAKNIYSFDKMLKHADAALYEAKSAGRNCVKVYKPKK
jgi:diguanylate cyclase (GGDEF)-like protein